MVEIMHYKDVNDKPATMVDLGQSYLSCSYHYIRKYHIGDIPPNYPMPARLVSFDYWPAKDTDSGRPALYGHDHYKPGRWFEFLTIE